MPKSKWDAEGQPANLTAAIEDALEWMHVARNFVRRDADAVERVDRAVAALRKHAKMSELAATRPES